MLHEVCLPSLPLIEQQLEAAKKQVPFSRYLMFVMARMTQLGVRPAGYSHVQTRVCALWLA